MSLINDALKRVKEAQRQAPPPASVGPQLRPVEPVPSPRQNLGLLLPVGLVGVALLTLLLVWTLAKKEDSSGPIPVRAQVVIPSESTAAKPAPEIAHPSSETPAAVPSTKSEPLPAGNSSLAQTSSPALKPSPSPATATNTAAQETAGTNHSSPVQVANAAANADTNPPAVVAAPPPQPPPLKLQGIVFSQRPSAVINGKTLFVGDRIREFRVMAITQDTALLSGGGRTNLLSLSE